MKSVTLSDEQAQTLLRMLDTAVNAKRDHARAMRECATAGGNPMIGVEDANYLARQHEETLADYTNVRDEIGQAVEITITQE